MKKAKWFIYSVLVGLIPFFCRLTIFLFLREKNFGLLFNEADFIVFGLVLNITNINELQHVTFINKKWKIQSIGYSIISIILYSVFFSVSILSTLYRYLFDITLIKYAALILSITTFIFSYSIHDYLEKSNIVQ